MTWNPVRVRRTALGVAVAAGAAFLVIAGYVLYCALTLPLPHQADTASGGAVLYANDRGQAFAARGVYRGQPLKADHLPANLVKAVVAIEDRRFYSHPGIDLRGILRAAWDDLTGSQSLQGGSTITQQLARLLYLSPQRTFRRKVQEMLLAFSLESRLTKNQILAEYLNRVYFGAGAIGADAAARRYFDKKADRLDIAEAAMLAGLIRAPTQLSPMRNLAAARRRERQVLEAMVEDGAIGKAEEQAAAAEKLRLALPPEAEPDDNYFVDTAEAEVKRLIGAPSLDLSVATTFDPRLQDAAEMAVKNWVDRDGARRHIGQAALVAMAPNGAILAMVGGRDYRDSQFNRATQAKRQPGSLFKIFVYLTALANGYTPDSTMMDQPVQIDGWTPHNYDNRYRGKVTLETAFAQSINTVAAQLGQAVGIAKVAEMAKSLGVQSDLPAVPSLALGSADVTLLEMTRAMDVIATDRVPITPYTVQAIRSNASTLFKRPDNVPPRPPWQKAWAPMMRLLEAVVTDGTGKAAQLDGRKSAGKTGTTDDYRDAWFIGFTTDLVVGVWVGNDDNSPMDKVTGGDVPAKIWHDFMTNAERILATPAGAAPAATPADSAPPQPQPEPQPVTPVAAAESAPVAEAPIPPAPHPATAPQAPAEALRGIPLVINSGTLLINGTVAPLAGVAGRTGKPANDLYRYIAGRQVTCQPAAAGQYRCTVGDYDLSAAAVLNGAARATPSASAELRSLEQQARTAHRGIWATPDAAGPHKDK